MLNFCAVCLVFYGTNVNFWYVMTVDYGISCLDYSATIIRKFLFFLMSYSFSYSHFFTLRTMCELIVGEVMRLVYAYNDDWIGNWFLLLEYMKCCLLWQGVWSRYRGDSAKNFQIFFKIMYFPSIHLKFYTIFPNFLNFFTAICSNFQNSLTCWNNFILILINFLN